MGSADTARSATTAVGKQSASDKRIVKHRFISLKKTADRLKGKQKT